MPGVGTTHHVKIGSDWFLVHPGSYRKRPAPLFGSRFTTGDPDYNNLSFWQHWAQTCWVGGLDAEVWMDDAMYDEAVGIDTTQHEVMTLARDLGRPGSGNWNFGGTNIKRQFIRFNDKMYCVEFGTAGATAIWRYNDGADTWTNVHTFGQDIRAVCSFSGKLWFGDGGANISYMTPGETFSSVAKPAGITDVPYSMMVYRDKMYVGFGRKIYRMKHDETWDGSTAFYEAVGIDFLIAMEVHLGFLYMASKDGHILRTDGNNTFDLWSMDAGALVTSMRSFDGKLFVACNEPLAGTLASQGVLYHFSGAAVTELKRWGKEGASSSLGHMTVAAKRLWYGASNLFGFTNGFGIAAYDPIEDAHSIFATNRDGTTYNRGTSEGDKHQVDDIYWWKGYLYVSVRGHGAFRTKYTFKDVTRYQATYDTTANGANPASLNGGWITSSDFDAGTPGLKKLWNGITIHVDLPTAACSVTVEYSLDGGITWKYADKTNNAALSTITGNGVDTRFVKTWKLDTVRGPRIKYRLSLRTTDTTRSPQVRAMIIRYLPIPEANWQWEMSLVLSETQELLDGTVEELNGAALNAKTNALENIFRQQLPVFFQDIDGTQWTTGPGNGVILYDLQKDVRFIGPSSDGPLESVVRIVLLEAVETY